MSGARVKALEDELVKPLHWERHPCGWIAAPPTGRAYIIDTRAKGKATVIKGLTFTPQFDTLEEAQAACWGDYTHRILAAVDLARIEALEAQLAEAVALVEDAYYEGFAEGDDGGWSNGDYSLPWKRSEAHKTLASLNHPASAPTPSPEANTCECGMTGPCKSDECKHPFLTATPSLDGVVKAALMWAADVCDNERHNLNALTSNPPQSAAAVGARNILQHSASDPDTIAAIIKTAEEKKDE
jgi:hypothetical protein